MAGELSSRRSASTPALISTLRGSPYCRFPAFLRRRASGLPPPRPCSARLLSPSPASVLVATDGSNGLLTHKKPTYADDEVWKVSSMNICGC